jgi:hypothetical protein
VEILARMTVALLATASLTNAFVAAAISAYARALAKVT